MGGAAIRPFFALAPKIGASAALLLRFCVFHSPPSAPRLGPRPLCAAHLLSLVERPLACPRPGALDGRAQIKRLRSFPSLPTCHLASSGLYLLAFFRPGWTLSLPLCWPRPFVVTLLGPIAGLDPPGRWPSSGVAGLAIRSCCRPSVIVLAVATTAFYAMCPCGSFPPSRNTTPSPSFGAGGQPGWLGAVQAARLFESIISRAQGSPRVCFVDFPQTAAGA